MDPIEAVADAIMAYEGWKPGSVSYRNRNPGNLRSSQFATYVGVDGFAEFDSLVNGYIGLKGDLRAKFSGKNEHGITGDTTLLGLMQVYAPAADKNVPLAYAQFVAHWVTLALGQEIHTSTTLREIAPEVCGSAPAPPAVVGA